MVTDHQSRRSAGVGAPADGVVALLLVDLDGRASERSVDSEASGRAVVWYEMLIRAAIEGEGGRVVKSTGSCWLAAFASPTPGLAAAVAALRALGGERWPTPQPPR